MARRLNEDEALVEVGVMGLRGPKGDFVENVKLYKIVSARTVNPQTGMTKEEESMCGDIAAVLAEKFGQYVQGVRKAGLRE